MAGGEDNTNFLFENPAPGELQRNSIIVRPIIASPEINLIAATFQDAAFNYPRALLELGFKNLKGLLQGH